jgi:hypothetical protein
MILILEQRLWELLENRRLPVLQKSCSTLRPLCLERGRFQRNEWAVKFFSLSIKLM